MSFENVDEILFQQEESSDSAVAAFKRELQKVRTGRASTGILEGIQVDYYGAKTALQHLGQVSTPESNLIVVQVYDGGAASAVEKAIQTCGLGFNPSREGSTIRVSVPPLSEERRKELVRHLHKMTEDIRISIRNHRREANDAVKTLEKEGNVTKDDLKKVQDRIQKVTDSYIQKVDVLLQQKEAEVLEV